MDGVGIVALQAAGRAGKTNLARLEQSARQVEEQVTPQIMITIEMKRPSEPVRVISPKPVVVSAVTVK